MANWQNGQIADAEAALTAAQEWAKLGQNHYIRLLAIGFSGMAQAAQGHLRKAASMLEAALTWGAEWPASAMPHLVFGVLYYGWKTCNPQFLAPARLALAQGKKAAAASHLAAEFDKADQAGWRYGQIEIRLPQALAAADAVAGLMFLTEALAMAQSANFLRTFLDNGTALVPPLHIAARRQVFPEYARTPLTFF